MAILRFILKKLSSNAIVKLSHRMNIYFFKKSKNKKIIFFVNDKSKWSTDVLYYELKNKFNVKIVLLRKFENQNESEFLQEINFFKKKGDVVVFNDLNFLSKIKLVLFNHIAFFQQPWGMQNFIRIQHFFLLSIYVPYSVITVNDTLDYCVEDFHKYLWVYVSQNNMVTLNFNKYRVNNYTRCLEFGYPKFDDLNVFSKKKS